MSNQEIKLAVLETKIDNLSEKVEALVMALKEHINKEDEAFKRIEDLKANKWVEKVVIGVIIGAALTIVGLILKR